MILSGLAREYQSSYPEGVPVEELVSSVQMTTPPCGRARNTGRDQTSCRGALGHASLEADEFTASLLAEMSVERTQRRARMGERDRGNVCMHGDLKS
jgi:hypothetical protein